MVVLDHVAFGVRSRSEAREAMRALGFEPSPPCRCEWTLRGRAHAADATCCVFAREYLDLIEVSDPAWQRHLEGSRVYERGLAPTGIVLSGVDVERAARHVASQPYAIERTIDVDPPRRVPYEFLALAGTGLPLGLIRDTAPESLRAVSSLAHPNTAVGIARVHLRVPSVDAARRRLGAPPLSLPPASEIRLGASRLCLHDPGVDGYLGRVSSLLPPRAERPALLALEYTVASIDTTRDVLRSHGVAFGRDGCSLTVDPEQGFGTGVVFSPHTER